MRTHVHIFVVVRLWHQQLLMLSAFRRALIALGGATVSLARASGSLLCICCCCCTFFTCYVINFHYWILLCNKVQPLRFAIVVVNICCGCLTAGFDVSFSVFCLFCLHLRLLHLSYMHFAYKHYLRLLLLCWLGVLFFVFVTIKTAKGRIKS